MASRSAKKNPAPSKSVMVPAAKAGEAPIAIPGKAVMSESKQRAKGFKSGGPIKGGSESMAAGTCGPGSQRLDRKSRPAKRSSGGAVSMRGRSPLSAAANTAAASTRTSH